MLENFIKVMIDKLVPADWNYKKDDDRKLEVLKNNFKRNGQVENIIIRELETGFYEVVNGNHRLKAMQDLGITEVMAYNCGVITKQEAMRLAIETNETRFETDQYELALRIEEIKEEFPFEGVLDTLPFTLQEIQHLNALATFNIENLGVDGTDLIPEMAKSKAEKANEWTVIFDNPAQKNTVREYINTTRDMTGISEGDFIERMIKFCGENNFEIK